MNLKQHIRSVPDFPKPGIMFRDITPLLKSPAAMRYVVQQLAESFRDSGVQSILAAEARGFIFGAPLAMELGAAFVPVRKPGKLPAERHSHSYALEYGTDKLEMHVDGVKPAQRVLVVDDVLATGGTVGACCTLLEKSGASIVGCAFAIELSALGGAQAVAPHPVFSVIQY